jgi:hypothetical protein
LQSVGTYGGSDYTVRASVRYNGVELPQVNRPYNFDSYGRFLSCQTHELYQLPSGSGSGLQLGAYCPSLAGGQIRNLRIVAVDLDVNNTDLPQQSANGWLWAANDGSQTLTTSWASYASTPQFTPDGGDYLVIVSGTVHPGASDNPVVYLGVGVDGAPSNSDYYQVFGTAYSCDDYITLISPKVIRFPKSPTVVSLTARVSASSSVALTGAHVLVLRLDTFTKRAGTTNNPAYTTGTSWQSATSITPSPAAVAGDQFLIFSHIRANYWQSELGTISEQVLRNPGATQAVIGSSCWHRYTWDNHGPFFCTLDTANGANSYELQFKRDAITNEPAYFYQHTLVALKAEVEYAPQAKTYLPVITATGSGGTMTTSYVDYVTIPGYKLIDGHRYLVLAYAEIKQSNAGLLSWRLNFNGSTLLATEQTMKLGHAEYTASHCMERITGTGSGTGITLSAYSSSVMGAIRNLRVVAIDLDVNGTDFPQDSVNGWQWASNDTAVTLNTTRTPHCSLTFTPDGVSDYLIIGVGRARNIALLTHAYFGIGFDTGGMLTYRVHQADGNEKYVNLEMWTLKRPIPTPTRISYDGYLGAGSSGFIDYSRVIVIRLDTFVKHAALYNGSPVITTPSTDWQSIGSVTPSLASVGDNFLVFNFIQAYYWVTSGDLLNKRLLRGPASTVLDTQQFSNTSDIGDFYGPAIATLDVAKGSDSYELQIQRNTSGSSPQYIYYGVLAAVSTEVKYTAQTRKFLPYAQTQTNGASSAFPNSPSWLLLATIPGFKLANGHRHLVLATFSQAVFGKTSEYCATQLRFNGAAVTTSQESHDSTSLVPAFMMARITGTGSGDGLQLYGQKHAISSISTYVTDIRLVAIDLDAYPTEFPESNKGWLYAENTTPASSPLHPTFLRHTSLTFTPDGTSDYLVLASLTLYDSGQNAGESRVRLQRDDVDVEAETVYFDGLTVGQSTHLCVAKYLAAPSAVSTTFGIEGARKDSASYPTISRSSIFVICLSSLKTWKAELTAGDQQFFNTGTWNTLESGAPAVSPEVNEYLFYFARSRARFGGTFAYHRIRDTVAGIDRYSTIYGAGYGTSGSNHYPYIFSGLAPVSVASPSYSFDQKNEPGYPQSPIYSQTLLMLLGTELKAATFENVAADTEFSFDADAEPEVVRTADADSLIELGAEAEAQRITPTTALTAMTWGGVAAVSDAPQAVNRTPQPGSAVGTLEPFRFSARAALAEIDRAAVRAYFGTGRCHYDGGSRPEDYQDVHFYLEEFGGTTPDRGATREIDIDGALVLSKLEFPIVLQEATYFFGGLEAPAETESPLMMEVKLKLKASEVATAPDGFTGVAFGLMAGNKGISVKLYNGGTYFFATGVVVQSAGRLVTTPPNLSYAKDLPWDDLYLTYKLLWDPARDRVRLYVSSGDGDVEDRLLVSGLVGDFPDLPAEEIRENTPWAFFGHVGGTTSQSISRWKFVAFYNYTECVVESGLFSGGVTGFLRTDSLVEYLPTAVPEKAEQPWKPLPSTFPGGVGGAYHLEAGQLVVDRTTMGKSIGFTRTELALPNITVFDFKVSVKALELASGVESSGVEFFIDDGDRCTRLGFLQTNSGTQYVGLLADSAHPELLNSYSAVVQNFEVEVFYRIVFNPAGTVDLYRLVLGEGLKPEYVLSVAYSALPVTTLPGPGLGFLHNATPGGALARLRLSALRYSCNISMVRSTDDPLPADWVPEGAGSTTVSPDREYIELADTTDADSIRIRKNYTSGLQADSGFALEFRARVVSYEVGEELNPIRSLTGMVVAVVDDTNELRLCFADAGPPYGKIVFLALSSDDEESLLAIRSGVPSSVGTFVPLDWSMFHLYRMIKTIGGKTRLFVDDSVRPVIELNTDLCSFAPSSGGTPRVVFGHKAADSIKTVSQWSHVSLSISRGFDFSFLPALSEEELKARVEHSVNVLLELGDTT